MAFNGIPTEQEFKEACGRTGPGKIFKTKNDLDPIFTALRAAEQHRLSEAETAVPPLRAVRKASCAWLATNKAVTRVSKPHVDELLTLVHAKITDIIERTYAHRHLGLAWKTQHAPPPPGGKPIAPHVPTMKNVVHRVMEVTQIKGAPVPGGKALEGNYWIEKILPTHIGKMATAAAVAEWGKAQSKTKLNAQDWIEKIYVPECEDDPSGATLPNRRIGLADKIKGAGVKYCDGQERQSYVMRIERGTVSDAQGQTADTSHMKTVFSGPGWAIFVIAPDDKLYVNSHVADAFHHSSFLAGAPIKCGGEIKIVAGKITHVTPKTGHYKAGPKELEVFLQFCQQKGVSLREVQVCPKPFDENKQWFKGSAVLLAHGDTPTAQHIAAAEATGKMPAMPTRPVPQPPRAHGQPAQGQQAAGNVRHLIDKFENIGKPGAKT